MRSASTYKKSIIILLLVFLFLPKESWALSIGDFGKLDLWEQTVRFFSFQDSAVRYAVIGTVLLGASCGLLGSFIVVRKMALMGDALSHAVLPGVALGFLWGMSKDPLLIFIGATIAGLLGSFVVTLIKETTVLKEDTALGMVLASFFAVGICLVTMIQQHPSGNKSGIDKFMFGQAAAISEQDLILMGIVTVLVVGVVAVFYKEFLVTSFDAHFAGTLGVPARFFHYLLMLLLAFSVVIALQAVGVVLVSAMLITPAASAYLLTDRMHRMVGLSIVFGVGVGVVGCFFSFMGNNLPTGPCMVLAATLVFLGAFCFGPRHGVCMRWFKQLSQEKKIQRENTLKAIYRILERKKLTESDPVALEELAHERKYTFKEIQEEVRQIEKHQLATTRDGGEMGMHIFLTPEGWLQACTVVRNHRLWELYLTNAAHYESDHVHEDAEKIEHILGEETVRELERSLNYAKKDPHGKLIPDVADLRRKSNG